MQYEYIKEARHVFPGGYHTAYLLQRDSGLYIHAITRMDNGSFLKSAPKATGPVDLDRALNNAAECGALFAR